MYSVQLTGIDGGAAAGPGLVQDRRGQRAPSALAEHELRSQDPGTRRRTSRCQPSVKFVNVSVAIALVP